MFQPRQENRGGSARAWSVGALTLAALVLMAMPAMAQRKPAAPPSSELADRYERCMNLAQAQPAQGLAEATRWRADNGGYAAMHCEASALYNLKRFDEAARRFHDVAEGTTTETAELRAEAYDQAAQAWLTAQKPQRARAEYDAALKLLPKNIDLLLGRAQAEGLAHDFWAALDDLNAALDIDPRRADALVLRAAAYRQVDATDLAMDDVTRAIALSPQFPDAYLERGTLMASKDDFAGARKDWNKVRELAPNTFVAELAERNLARLNELSGKPVPAKSPKPATPPAKQ
jgi:tetratricopeptide (TPR) repeat protein